MNEPFLCFHYDIARGDYLQPETFCKALRLAARSGYTHFLPYLENMIRLPSMERACPDCAYTAPDWRLFEATAAEAGIALIPHFNVIGHTELIAPAYPELCEPSEAGTPPEMDVTHPDSEAWMLRCLDEFCAISGDGYFLVGGDEWQPSRRLLAREGFDVADAWVRRVNVAVEFLSGRGRRPIVWHDMLLHYPSTLERLSRKAAIAFWFYDYDSDYAVLRTFKARGFETLMATAVFDSNHPLPGRRAIRALQSAAAARKDCDGWIVTTWENCRWELEALAIPLASQILRGGMPCPEIVEVGSLFPAWSKLPSDSALARQWRTRMETLLESSSWDEFPEARRALRARLQENFSESLASHGRFHYPQGRGHERAAAPLPERDWPSPAHFIAPRGDSGFGVCVTADAQRGDVLGFRNGEERFILYPRFGASLQDWRRGDAVLIRDGMEAFLRRGMLPGGYRSYTAAGGFRPIWALGAHSNPCILWQHPWQWAIQEQTAERVRVALHLRLPQGAFSLCVGIARNQPGFSYEARCINALEGAFGAFNFNFPLAFGLNDLTDMSFSWEEGVERRLSVAEAGESALWIPARGALTIHHPRYALRIEAAPERTAGYFVDWGAGFITPDLRGVYQPLTVGQETTARWQLG